MDALDIIHAAKNPAMNTYKIDDAKESVRSAIDCAYRLAEQQLPTGPDYQQLVDDVTDKILKSYPYITSQEVMLVAEAGVAGELGNRVRPSAAAFFGWLAAYMASDLRKETIRNYRRNNGADPASRSLLPDEIAELNRKAEVRALRTLWAEFKRDGKFAADHLDGYVAMACDGFMKRNIMTVTEENWRQAKELAQRAALRKMGSNWVNRALPYDPVFLTKRMMLTMCFTGLKNAGYELEVNA